MKKFFTILSMVAAALALILSVLPVSNLAFIPCIAALLFGVLAFITNKENQSNKKTIQLAFLLTIIALCISTYKAIFNETEIGDTKELEIKEQESIEDAKQQLENDGLLIEPIEETDTDSEF